MRDDVAVITANPKTAGVARWIFFALWGVRLGKGRKAAVDYVTKVFDQVVVQPRDAREASDVFYRQVGPAARGGGPRRAAAIAHWMPEFACAACWGDGLFIAARVHPLDCRGLGGQLQERQL